MSSSVAVFISKEVELVIAFEGCRAIVSLRVTGGFEEFGDDCENVAPRVEDPTNLPAQRAPRTPDRCPFQDITDPDRRRVFNETRRFAEPPMSDEAAAAAVRPTGTTRSLVNVIVERCSRTGCPKDPNGPESYYQAAPADWPSAGPL
ncbi:hypothetical protein BSKO_13351 [Bryopsis sp. KO-2023]|nr:hypothetical protein BSKO_13351 [Bryopsis sp. KO-2023]